MNHNQEAVLTRLEAVVALLQEKTAGPEYAEWHEPLADLAEYCVMVRRILTQGTQMLAKADEELQAVLAWLQQESEPVTASQLAEMLEPVQRQVQLVVLEVGQLL